MIHEWLNSIDPTMKHILDGVALFVSFTVYLSTLLPSLTAAASLIWILLRIYWGFQDRKKPKTQEDL